MFQVATMSLNYITPLCFKSCMWRYEIVTKNGVLEIGSFIMIEHIVKSQKLSCIQLAAQ